MNVEKLRTVLIIAIIALVIIVAVVFLLVLLVTSKNKKQMRTMEDENNDEKGKNDKKKNSKEVQSKIDAKDVAYDYVQNFMEFDEIIDNMIVQQKGAKYIMVIKCQGINFDLMTEAEMISVEEGFIQFLNVLRFPVQLYVQTRSLDLTNSLNEYNDRLSITKDELDDLSREVRRLKELDEDEDEIERAQYEYRKKKNIYDYGKDIISNVEKLSKNKNILQQGYYVVVPYYIAELGPNSLKKEEYKDMAFSELYTRCRGLISSLAVCSVRGQVLNSFELAELLHLAYNRDEGEIFSFRDAIEAKYDRLYHTAPDVLKRKQVLIDQEIQETAAAKANEEIIKASGQTPGSISQNNSMIEELVYKASKQFVKEYSGLIEAPIIDKALDNMKLEHKEKIKEEAKAKEEVKSKNKNKEKGSIETVTEKDSDEENHIETEIEEKKGGM